MKVKRSIDVVPVVLVALGLIAIVTFVVLLSPPIGTAQAKPTVCHVNARKVLVCKQVDCGKGCTWDPVDKQCDCGVRDCGKNPYKWNPYSYGFQRQFDKWCETSSFDEREVMYSGQWCDEIACAEGFKPAEFCDFSEGGAPPEMWTCPEPESPDTEGANMALTGPVELVGFNPQPEPPGAEVSGVEPSPFAEE